MFTETALVFWGWRNVISLQVNSDCSEHKRISAISSHRTKDLPVFWQKYQDNKSLQHPSMGKDWCVIHSSKINYSLDRFSFFLHYLIYIDWNPNHVLCSIIQSAFFSQCEKWSCGSSDCDTSLRHTLFQWSLFSSG